MRRFPYALPWCTLAVAVADLVALRSGSLVHTPWVLAGLFTAAGAGFAVQAVLLAALAVRVPERRMAAGAGAFAAIGVLTVVAGGMTNWLLGLQGFAILSPGERVSLSGGGVLQDFETGPLARLDEMEVVVDLEELELRPAGGGRFTPVSRLRCWRGHHEPAELEVAPGAPGAAGPLRFHQGAFGFAPRIVILHGEAPARSVFDRVVPFVTERHGADGLSFEGRFEIAAEALAVRAAVDLASLDDGMRGHATLRVEVEKDGVPLGGGALLPGHFAELERDYRVGFAGLERWSELVISRRNYTGVMVIGATLAGVAALAWAVARWRGW